MSVHRLRRNDTRPYFRVVMEIDHEAVDLTGAAVAFHMKDESGVLRTSAPATIVQSAPTVDRGVVEYRWTSGDTGQSGKYLAQWEVTFPDGTVQTFPTIGIDHVLIGDDLG